MKVRFRDAATLLLVIGMIVAGLASHDALAQAGSGTLYTLGFSGGHVAVFEVNPVTGATTLLVETDAGSTSDVAFAFDPVQNRLFFRSSSELYTVNLDAGTFSHVAATGLHLEFDPVTQQLYTVAFSGGFVAIFTLDPLTGAATLVATTDAPSISGDASAFDPAGRRFFFRGPSEVYAVNVATGMFTHFPASGLTLQFDTATRLLYTLRFSGPNVALFSIDPANGNASQVVVTDATGVLLNVSAFDAAGRRFFFRSGTTLYTINIGAATFSSVISSGFLLEFAHLPMEVPALSPALLMFLMCALAMWAIVRLR